VPTAPHYTTSLPVHSSAHYTYNLPSLCTVTYTYILTFLCSNTCITSSILYPASMVHYPHTWPALFLFMPRSSLLHSITFCFIFLVH